MGSTLLVAVFLSLCLSANTSYVTMPGLPDDSYTQMGDFNIGVLLPVHHHSRESFCSEEVRNLGVLQRVEAVRFAIDEINNRTDILPDHKLGFIMYDDCYKGITTLAQSMHFIKQSGEGECLLNENVPAYCYNESITTHEVVGIIGSESSTTTVQMANLFSSFQMPQISYLATASVLTESASYPFFRRIVPSDKLQAKVIVSLLMHFNWSYVSVMHMEDEYGTKGFQDLHEAGHPWGVCFAAVFEIRRDFQVSDYNYMVYKILKENKAKVVIVIAFKTRKLPGNYNESKFISFCVYSTVIIWCAFVPAYFAVGKAFFEVMFLSLVVLANATLILCCIFLPKVYALYFVDKEDLQVSPQFTKQKGTRRLIEEVSASTNSEVNKVIDKMADTCEKSPSTGTLDRIREGRETTTTTTATVETTMNPTVQTEDAATSTDLPFHSSMVHVSPAPTTYASPVDLWF